MTAMHLDNFARDAFGKSFAKSNSDADACNSRKEKYRSRNNLFLYDAFARFSRRACVDFAPVK